MRKAGLTNWFVPRRYCIGKFIPAVPDIACRLGMLVASLLPLAFIRQLELRFSTEAFAGGAVGSRHRVVHIDLNNLASGEGGE